MNWLVSGCSSGLGLALVESLLASGENVVLASRKREPLESLLECYSQSAAYAEVDVRDAESAKLAVLSCLSRFGSVDVLVNNAGVGLVGALEEYSDEELRDCFETNFFGAVNFIRAALPHMRERKKGKIFNISAVAGFANEVGFTVYGASKFAVEGLSEALQSEVRHVGIQVVIVEPGPFRTGLIGKMKRSDPSEAYSQTAGKFADFLTRLDGKQSGDPKLFARAVIECAQRERPPQRLVLGPYARKKVEEKLKRVAQDLETSVEIAPVTDFAG